MIDEQDWSRLARFFAGESSPAEAAETRQWLDADPLRAVEADRLRVIWTASGHLLPPVSSDAAWDRLAARMHAADGPSPVALHHPEGQAHASRFRWRHESPRARAWMRVAAAAVVVAAGSALFEYNERFSQRVESRIAEQGAPDREFHTARGQRAVVTLGDGSHVELGAESSLRVRAFGAGPRELFLTGQAVFEVVHDSTHPFLVHSNNAITEDIGTRFSIRAYPRDADVQVLVTSGKVNLRAANAPRASGTLLGPSDLGTLDSIGRTTVRNGVDSTSFLAWTHDRLVYTNAALADVVPDIARTFDVRIDVRPSVVPRQRITMSVPTRALSEVLGAVTVPLGLHYEISGRTVVIR
ncbi:MAG: FecR domain-containing protein [bacterium]